MMEFVKDEEYLPKICEMLSTIEQSENALIEESARVIYSSLREGGVLHVFATGHSHMIADELFYRSGGLVPVNPLLSSDIMVYEGAIHSTMIER